MSGALPPGQRNMRIAVQKVSRPSYTSRRQTAALNIWICAALKAVSHVLLISKPWSLIKNQSIPHVHRAIGYISEILIMCYNDECLLHGISQMKKQLMQRGGIF